MGSGSLIPLESSCLFILKNKIAYAIVNLKKEYICQEGLLKVYWAQIQNQCLAAIADGLLTHTVFQRKATD